MIVDMDLETGALQNSGKTTDPVDMLAINNDQAGHPIQIDILGAGQRGEVLGMTDTKLP